MKKIISIGIILIFLLTTLVPMACANNTNEKSVEIEVSDYKSDGTLETKIVELSKDTANRLKTELLETNDIEKRLKILKKYDLTSDSTSTQNWYQGMIEKSKKLDIPTDIRIQRTGIRLPILLQFFTKVTAVYIGGVSIRLGLSPIMNLLNLILPINLPGIDLIDASGAVFGILTTSSLLKDHIFVNALGVMAIAGFVGNSIKFPLVMHIFTGYSAMTFGMGLGIHIVDSGNYSGI